MTCRQLSRDGGTTATFWVCAAYGAAVAMVASFVPGSTIVGGGAAAYLRDSDDSVRVGAATGLVGAALTVPLVAFLGVGFLAGGSAVGELHDCVGPTGTQSYESLSDAVDGRPVQQVVPVADVQERSTRELLSSGL